ncbi:Septum-promoting GTP-binding protein 1 [Linum grandiflorum]
MGRSNSSPARKVQCPLLTLRRCILQGWKQLLICSVGKPIKYRILSHSDVAADAPAPATSLPLPSSAADENPPPPSLPASLLATGESDLVSLKISLLGDSQIGKTSFLAKYVGGDETAAEGGRKDGLNLMDKVLEIGGARISYSLWEFDGGEQSREQIPVACKDSVAILIMFDLTSRVTLNGVMGWYQEARKWNQTAIPILIGTKFDDFILLPIDLQWTIASQARTYAKALNAPLFFSSATYNINVNKIFKFITAKIFDLPWTLERNLTIGEPIIDF